MTDGIEAFLGPRYVCAGEVDPDCDWSGYPLGATADPRCRKCCGPVLDRWQDHADQCDADPTL